MNSPIPADHISNTNPLLPGAPPGNAAEGEVLELAAKLAFHGRRLFRHEASAAPAPALHCPLWPVWRLCRASAWVRACLPPHPQVAATAWRLQFAEYWAKEQGAKTGDELRLAAAQLRAMLGDEDEIKWRRRGVIGLVRLAIRWRQPGLAWERVAGRLGRIELSFSGPVWPCLY